MSKILSLLLFFLLSPFVLPSQILPQEGSVLNYRLIGFLAPCASTAVNYKFEIAQGTYYSDDSFTRNIIQSSFVKDCKTVMEVPSFGRQYTWRVIITNVDGSFTKRPQLHHFSAGAIAEVDSNTTRLRILKAALKYHDDYVFLDGTKALYDMTGRPIWFLPDIDGIATPPIDIKSTAQGTITFLFEGKAYEVNYNGKVLWKAPARINENTDSQDYYHHALTRLSNGHYMTLGNEFVAWNHENTTPGKDNSKPGSRPMPSNLKTLFGTIIEFDETGNIVWMWKSSKYFTQSDLINYIPQSTDHGIVDVHENSFYFDEKDQAIYVGFKNISRILKIKYPEGNVVNVFGETYRPGLIAKGNGLFCEQHACNYSSHGYLYLYNNNNCSSGPLALPEIVLFTAPSSGKTDMKKLWEYRCTSDGIDLPKQLAIPRKDLQGRRLSNHQTSGGNVIEMPGNSFFVSMSGPYCKIFIVNKDKQILWSALPEQYNAEQHRWDPISEYRASIIDRARLEKLIWNTEIKTH